MVISFLFFIPGARRRDREQSTFTSALVKGVAICACLIFVAPAAEGSKGELCVHNPRRTRRSFVRTVESRASGAGDERKLGVEIGDSDCGGIGGGQGRSFG